MTKINYKSDFDFILTLRDAQGNDIGFPKFNWEARFWTFSPMCAMTASCHDGECVNCFNDNGKIHIVFNAPTLGCGQLRVEVATHRENDIYPDGERTLYTPDVLDIELVNGKGDAKDVNVDIVFPATGTAKVLPRIEVRVCRDKNVDGKDPTNNGRAYLRLLNAQPYLDAGYKPILLRKCVRKQQYRKKRGDNRWDVHTKGWHIRGSQEALRLTPTQLGSFDDNIEHIVAITEDEFFNFASINYSLKAIDFVKPHPPKFNGVEWPNPNDIVVSWGTRRIRIYDDDGSEDGSASINAPIRFKFGIAFQKDSNFDKTQLNLPISEIVSNIATFSVLFNGAQTSIDKQDATNADCYRFGY